MSPFLVHMTGKNQIIRILSGWGCKSALPEGSGFLRASIPDSSEGKFAGKVVCFTESPTFALDFFRYRSFSRWNADKRFGIGFSKDALVKHGVRPVVYLDDSLIADVIQLHQRATQGGSLGPPSETNKRVERVIRGIYPLLFPLLTNHSMQGFMWEREWRYPFPDGMIFDHSDIQVICCPEEEVVLVREMLGDTAETVQFVHVWREYDEITTFLRSREMGREVNDTVANSDKNRQYGILQLERLVKQYNIAIHSLESYDELVTRLSQESKRLGEEKQRLVNHLADVQKQLDERRQEIKSQLPPRPPFPALPPQPPAPTLPKSEESPKE
jgi:hypothetical protein